jgi:hypothetical protein
MLRKAAFDSAGSSDVIDVLRKHPFDVSKSVGLVVREKKSVGLGSEFGEGVGVALLLLILQ